MYPFRVLQWKTGQSWPYFFIFMVLEHIVLRLEGKPGIRLNDGITSVSHGLLQECGSMPIQAPQWTDYLNCPACCREFSPRRSPISLSCGHTLCRPCLKNLIRKQCPFDQSVISMDLEELVVNTALLQLMGYDPPAQPSRPPSIQSLSEQDRWAYDVTVKSLEQLAVFLKYCCTASVNMIGNRLSRPMQRKLVTLLQCSLMDEEGRGKAARAARSLGERTVSELILQHQNPQQLSANLWAAVRSRGCQFLGPAMQEEVLKLVLLALEDGSPLSRKVLVMFVVQRLEPHFPQASKTSIGHVVQLLYRASCFKVSKRESDSSLMQLKEEFRTYECLRREHDAQIVQIATESGLRIAPDQWSALLYGDTLHKSHMQSIIDKLQTPHSFAQSVQELFFALQRTGDPSQLLVMSMSLDRLTNIDPSPDAKSPSWQELSQIMTALKDVVSGLVDYMQHHAAARDANHNLKIDRSPDASAQPSAIANHLPGRYKVAMCRDAQARAFCPRGNNCTYAHTEEELERYRRQDTPNLPQVYNTSPQPIAQPPLLPVFIYSPAMDNNKYNMMPKQQQSPSGRQHSTPDYGDVPNNYELEHARRRPSFESHQADIPRPNQRDINWSYANALEFGAANKRQRQNQIRDGWNGGTECPGGANSSMSPPIRKPGKIQHAPIWTVSVNKLCGGGILSSRNGGMQPPSNGGMRPLLNGGIDSLNRGMQPPINGGMHPLLNGGKDSFNGGIVPHNGRMVPLNAGMVPLNGGIGNYGENFRTLDDAMNLVNGGHKPPTDSRYFPRQSSENTANFQPQNQCGIGGMPAFEEMGADYEVPEFIPRKDRPKVYTPEPQNMEAFGLGSETRSRYENWQPAPPPMNVPQPRSMFRFSTTVKNLPEGLYPSDLVPVELTNTPQQPYMEGQNMSTYPANSMDCHMIYTQPMMVDQHTPNMEMPGPSDMKQNDETMNMDFENNSQWQMFEEFNPDEAVLDDLHQLAVRVTALGSDSEAE